MVTTRLIRSMLAARRVAVERGELRRMWPGAAWDVTTLVWWRGIYWPVHDSLWPPVSHQEAHPDCPGCNWRPVSDPIVRPEPHDDKQDDGYDGTEY